MRSLEWQNTSDASASTKRVQTELGRQCLEGILGKLPPLEVEKSEWGYPIFGVPKKDKKQIRTVGDFRVLNTMLECTPQYIEPIHELSCSIGRFIWVSNLDLPMAHYTMSLSPKSKTTITLVTIFGTCECQVLWMGVLPASDMFQGRVNLTLQDVLPMPPKSCIDDVLAALKHSFNDHVNHLNAIFMSSLNVGFQVNLEKSCTCQKELEFLGF